MFKYIDAAFCLSRCEKGLNLLLDGGIVKVAPRGMLEFETGTDSGDWSLRQYFGATDALLPSDDIAWNHNNRGILVPV